MRSSPQNAAPADAAQRRKAPAIVCYSVDSVPPYDRQFYESARVALKPDAKLTFVDDYALMLAATVVIQGALCATVEASGPLLPAEAAMSSSSYQCSPATPPMA